MGANGVHVLWKYDSDMQISFGVYASISDAIASWEAIHDSGVYISLAGETINFTDADFLPGAWFIETYKPGLDPQTILLEES